jgi:cytochrome c-type biogenesis protein CcsB
MHYLLITVTICYLLSSAGYFAYLFVQHRALYRMALGCITVGAVLHTVMIVAAFIASGYFPARNQQQTLSLAAWAVAGCFVVLQLRLQLRVLGLFAAPLAAIAMLTASHLPGTSMAAEPVLRGFWLTFHVIAIFLGEAALALAAGAGVLYLVQEHAIKAKKMGLFFKRLPSLELLDATGYSCIVAGFTLLTVGLVVGLVYAKMVWGRFWSWDPKEVWTGITWLLYAALLHERLMVGWRGRRAAVMAIIGFGALLFTFLGVNFFMSGHHGGFTRW